MFSIVCFIYTFQLMYVRLFLVTTDMADNQHIIEQAITDNKLCILINK